MKFNQITVIQESSSFQSDSNSCDQTAAGWVKYKGGEGVHGTARHSSILSCGEGHDEHDPGLCKRGTISSWASRAGRSKEDRGSQRSSSGTFNDKVWRLLMFSSTAARLVLFVPRLRAAKYCFWGFSESVNQSACHALSFLRIFCLSCQGFCKFLTLLL